MVKKHKRGLATVSESEVIPADVTSELKPHHDLLDEMKRTIDKLAADQATRGDLKILARTLKELRYAFKIFTPYRRHRKITVFGSARLGSEHPAYIQAVEFGRRMARENWMVLTGAGGGIMEGAHVGAGRDMSMGVNIMLPFEQQANYVIDGDPKLVHLKYFFTRKLLFVKEVHAIALFPGGFGTQDEAFETLTLVQTGKRDLMPIVCIDPPESTYWADWLEYVKKQLLENCLISPEDLSLFKVTSDLEEAVEEIMRFYCVYHSTRYVNGKLIIRLHKAPDDQLMQRINDQFGWICSSGKIEKTEVSPQEADDEHIAHLPRLSLHFDRRSMGGLRQLVDLLNDELGEEEC